MCGLKGRTVEAKRQIAQVKGTCFERQVCPPSRFREMWGMGRKVLARGLHVLPGLLCLYAHPLHRQQPGIYTYPHA